MSTAMISPPRTQTQNQNGRANGRRGRGGRGGRGGQRGGANASHGGGADAAQSAAQGNAPTNAVGPASEAAARLAQSAAAAAARAAAAAAENGEDEEQLCWICAEPVKYWSVSDCNHRTCHVCALRLRALYKKMDCTFCKEPQSSVIFTVSPDAIFSSYAPDSTPYKDSRLHIYFETQEMMEETMILLRFNCPEPTCDYIAAAGWGDLKLHARGVHGRQMCDVCIRHKKVFSHEHALYTAALLAVHLPSVAGGRGRGGRATMPPEQIEGGVHPMCEFCRECFFSGDELYPHMREQHEECFVCKRMEIRDQYFQNYMALERHFTTAHFPCQQDECLAKKFVVFGSAMDLQGHMVEEHGAAMTSKDRREAMKIQADFAFEDTNAGRGRRGVPGSAPHPPPAPPPQPGSSRGGRRRDFGGHLTTDNAAPPPPPPPRAPSPTGGPLTDDPEIIERQARFLRLVRSYSANPENADIAVRNAIRSYKASESSARDLISTIWNVMGDDVENTATIVNQLVDLLDDEDKKKDLLAAWNGFKIERKRDFPDLVPTSVGSGFAGVASGRVLNAKNATNLRTRGAPQAQIWDRVAQAAGSSSQRHVPGAFPPQTRLPERFPTLNPAGPSQVVPGRGQPAGTSRTAWSASSANHAPAPSSSSTPRVPYSVPGPGSSTAAAGKNKAKQPVLTASAFPTLPNSNNGPRAKPHASGNQSLRNILGEPAPVANPWTPGSGSSSGPELARVSGDSDNAASAGKGKKKGKGKQTLFTMGTIPS